MTRTGDSGIFRRFKWILALGAIISPLAQAGIRASVDRTEVPIDESVSFTISSSNTKDGDFDPKFDAQGFEVMNQIRSSKMSFSFNNGTFENGASHQITYILRPTKLGALKIRNIQSNGERAPDITIQVIQENLYKKAAPGEAPPLTGDAKNFFVKAELSKSRVYKGEQIVVSYYLYRRTRANVRDVLQYPNFQGFIREDLEMPILSNRPDFEAVNLGGIPFERALLARYAVYPIKDGKLRIDGFSVRVDYIPKNPGSEDMMEDPFFQFFTQVPLRTGSAKSDPVTVDVLPLPEEGKSAAFTGGVGDFELSAQTDSSQVKANSPLTLRYSLRGKGNTSLIEFPKVNWPADLKLYQSQGKTRNLGQGQQEKTFEVVIVPTKEGPSQIPPVEFEFFNPETRSYQKKTSPSIPVVVLPGDPGAPIRSSESAITDIPGVQSSPAPSTESQSYGSTRAREKQMDAKRSVMGTPLWRWVAWFGLAVFFVFLGLVGWDQTRKRSLVQLEILKKKQSAEGRWKVLIADLEASDPTRLSQTLEKAKDELYRSLDEAFAISSRALPIRDLAKSLSETHGVTDDRVKTVTSFLEFAEMVRFSNGAAFGSENGSVQSARERIESIRQICLDLPRNPLEKPS